LRLVFEDLFWIYARITTDFRDILLFYNLSQAEIQMTNEGSVIRSRIDEVNATYTREVSSSRMRKETVLRGR